MKVVKEYGLSIQCLTYIKDGTLYFDSFIVGKGIFYLIPNEELEYWDISKTNNGLKITDGYGEEIIFEEVLINVIINSLMFWITWYMWCPRRNQNTIQ